LLLNYWVNSSRTAATSPEETGAAVAIVGWACFGAIKGRQGVVSSLAQVCLCKVAPGSR